MNDAATDVDMQGEESSACKIAERLKSSIEHSRCLLVQRKINWLIDALALWFHGTNQSPAAIGWSGLSLSRVGGWLCDLT